MINQYIKNIKILNKFYYIFFLFFFSFFINQYYGYIGILPLDSFLIFNSGYDVLNGYYPFKDYWTIKGVLLDLLQGLFFKFFGLSWFSYVLHASFFNCIITLATFYTLLKFNLNINLSFFYSICVAILAYPTAGTPFSDHHVTIISMLCLYSFILAIKTDQIIYWFVLPILMGLAFLSKQAPSSYFILIISFLSLIYFIFNFNFKKIIYGLLGVLTFLIIFFSLLNFGDIKFSSFWEQYILFPKNGRVTVVDLDSGVEQDKDTFAVVGKAAYQISANFSTNTLAVPTGNTVTLHQLDRINPHPIEIKLPKNHSADWLSFSDDGKLLAVITRDFQQTTNIIVLDVDSQKIKEIVPVAIGHSINLRFTSDNKTMWLAGSGISGIKEILLGETGDSGDADHPSGPPTQLEIHPSGNALLAATANGEVTSLKLTNG